MNSQMQDLHHNSEPTIPPFEDETIEALKELGNAFYAVRRRLISEGYVIQEGRYVRPTNKR